MGSGFRRIRSAIVKMLLISFLAMLPLTIIQANAQTVSTEPQPEKIDQLLKLLADPEVKAWIAEKPVPASQEGVEEVTTNTIMLWSNGIRTHLSGLVKAIPSVRDEFARSGVRITDEINGRGPGVILTLFAAFAILGFGAEHAFQHWAFRRRNVSPPSPDAATPANTAIGASIFVALAPLAVFAVVSVGVFLVFNWPPLLAALVLPMLAALIAWRLMKKVTETLLAPDNQAARLVSLDDDHSLFWYRRISWFAGVFFTGWAAAGLMRALAFSPDVRNLIVYVIGLGLLAIALEIVWHHPDHPTVSRAYRVKEWALTFVVCLLWLLWVAGLSLPMWIGLYILILPSLLRMTTDFVNKLFLRTKDSEEHINTLLEVLIERGARVVIIVLAVAWLGIIVRARTAGLMEDENARRIIRGVVGGVIVFLTADLIWHIAKGVINRRIERARTEAGDQAALARSGRLLTLLPILKNFLAAFIIAIAVMMILSGLGVEIGPLIAGAGIFGVAIGFGSQSLVKDVISGVFYMTDDAFRVGEYIQSGTYKGTVESFSIRSVKLRHHRGPIFTVPFGSLGAIQNMSRDWTVVKFRISVGYGTDVEKARKLTKKIGSTMMEDPEIGPLFIEPLKMKGIEEFGDYGIQLSFGMTLRPSPMQSFIRRRANFMLRETFSENGIEFATPSVQVGGDEKAAAAASAILAHQRKEAPVT